MISSKCSLIVFACKGPSVQSGAFQVVYRVIFQIFVNRKKLSPGISAAIRRIKLQFAAYRANTPHLVHGENPAVLKGSGHYW